MIEVQISHDTSEPTAPRGKGTTYAAFARTPYALILGIAVVALVSIGLPGCSSQRDRAIVASDSPSSLQTSDSSGQMDYDPWEYFNDKTFYFNFDLADHYAIKPAAKVWAKVLPQQLRKSLANAFYNVAMPRRFVNKFLQARFPAAGVELARFVVNTTVGIAGFFDPASHLGLKKEDADTGETLALYGVKPGPYLVLPLLPPLTVRDTFGFAADSFMDPLSWFITPVAADFGRAAAQRINERADNMKLYDDVEDTSLDLYAAVRNGYLQRRHKFIEDAIHDRDRTWRAFSDRVELREQPDERDVGIR